MNYTINDLKLNRDEKELVQYVLDDIETFRNKNSLSVDEWEEVREIIDDIKIIYGFDKDYNLNDIGNLAELTSMKIFSFLYE